MKNGPILLLLLLVSNISFCQEVNDQALMSLEAEKIIETANARIVKSDTLIEFKAKETEENEGLIIDYRWKTITHYDSENRLVMKEQKMLSDPPSSVALIPSLAVWDEHNNYILECNNDHYGTSWAILKYDDKGVLLDKKSWNEKNEEIKGSNEIKSNLFSTLSGFPEINYEYLIENNTALGILANVSVASKDVTFRYIVVPYLRLYLGKKKAAGFFFEANSAIVSQETAIYDPATFYHDYTNHTETAEVVATKYTTNFGFGAALGSKFINKDGYLFELIIGGGRLFDIRNAFITTIYPRIGFSFGKRF